MARTIAEIQAEIIAAKEAQADLAGLTSNSRTAVWRLWIYITAVAFWTLETLFDLHRQEVIDYINNMKPGSAKWYANIAQAYQHGQVLPPDTDKYNNTGLTEDEIEERKIVAYAAVVEAERGLRIKVAKDNGTDLEPLDEVDELPPFMEYMARVKYAGIRLLITSNEPDSLTLNLAIYYDPLVLDSEGSRLDGSDNEPVQKAVRNYLRNLPFNGVFVLAYLVDVLQQVPGVVVPHILSASARYGALPYTSFNVEYQPDAGYLRLIDAGDLVLSFFPKSPVT